MSLFPTDFRTWTAFGDHPIFGPEKSNIGSWSHDAKQYGDLNAYDRFWPDHYVHVDPSPPIDVQVQIAERDITNLASACQQVEREFDHVAYELVILDDFTAYVWMRHERFAIEIYPCFPDEDAILKMFVDAPEIESLEHNCPTVASLVETLSQLLGTEPSDEPEGPIRSELNG